MCKPSDYDGRGYDPPYPTLADDNAMLVEDNQRLRAQLAAAEARLTFTPSPEQWQEVQSQLRAAKEQLATAHRLLRVACEWCDEPGAYDTGDWYERAKKEVVDGCV